MYVPVRHTPFELLPRKVRITEHLTAVIQQELTSPEGYKNANLGVLRMLNNM